MRFVLFVLIFLCVGCLMIINNNSLDIYNSDDLKVFGEVFSVWLGDVYSNLQIMTGNAVKLDWIPESSKLSLANIQN